MTKHIHQGGTLNTFCGLPVRPIDVSWEQADAATCGRCRVSLTGSN